METTQKLQYNNNSCQSSILTTQASLFWQPKPRYFDNPSLVILTTQDSSYWQLKPGLGCKHLLYPLCMKLQSHISGMLYSIVMITMSRISYYLTWLVGQLREPLVLFCLAFFSVNTTGEIKQANFNMLTNQHLWRCIYTIIESGKHHIWVYIISGIMRDPGGKWIQQAIASNNLMHCAFKFCTKSLRSSTTPGTRTFSAILHP